MRKIKEIFNKFRNGVLDMLYPKHIKCIFCSEELAELNLYDSCEKCLSTLPRINKDYCIHCGMSRSEGAVGSCIFCKRENPSFTLARAVLKYEGTTAIVIQNLKYNHAKYLAEPLAYFLFEKLKNLNWEIDLISFVPIHAKKLKQRGYNQAELLAKELSKLTNIECKNLFEKIKETPTQTKLTRQQRKKNIENSFKLTNKDVADKNILIVDDVFTTGATANELAKLLKNAKAKYVYILTLAHSVLKENI